MREESYESPARKQGRREIPVFLQQIQVMTNTPKIINQRASQRRDDARNGFKTQSCVFPLKQGLDANSEKRGAGGQHSVCLAGHPSSTNSKNSIPCANRGEKRAKRGGGFAPLSLGCLCLGSFYNPHLRTK